MTDVVGVPYLPWEDSAAAEARYHQGKRDGQWWIVLPLVKPLSMNDAPTMSRGARISRSNDVKALREGVHWLCKGQGIPACKRVRVTLIYEPPGLNKIGRRSNPRRDAINLAPTLKATQDGIVDAGVVPDDTGRYMESPMPLIDTPRDSQHGLFSVLIERLA